MGYPKKLGYIGVYRVIRIMEYRTEATIYCLGLMVPNPGRILHPIWRLGESVPGCTWVMTVVSLILRAPYAPNL